MAAPAVTAISAEITPAAMGAPARLTIIAKTGATEHRVILDHPTGEFPPLDFASALACLARTIARASGRPDMRWP